MKSSKFDEGPVHSAYQLGCAREETQAAIKELSPESVKREKGD
ncbi:hypothetical protein [Limosilactobacillus oris]|nr:hypothetical protein [Limosilactobacillus oris]MCW4387840.1 hypothetical protein [Limosilactobacillus oris]